LKEKKRAKRRVLSTSGTRGYSKLFEEETQRVIKPGQHLTSLGLKIDPFEEKTSRPDN